MPEIGGMEGAIELVMLEWQGSYWLRLFTSIIMVSSDHGDVWR